MSRNEGQLIDYLEELAQNEDRGALAALRKGLGKSPGSVPEMFEHIIPYISQGASTEEENACFMIASLFASYPNGSGEGDMGATFRRIANTTGSDSVEGRFIALLKCHPDELPEHLRHAVALARSKEAAIDWGQLLFDVKRWDDQDRSVQRRWARSFWEPSSDQRDDQGSSDEDQEE